MSHNAFQNTDRMKKREKVKRRKRYREDDGGGTEKA